MDSYFIHHTPVARKTNTEITLSQVENIYIGKGNCCRCGCGGKYYTPEENPKKVLKALEEFSSGKHEVESIDNYIFEIEISSNSKSTKVITLYLKK